MWDVTADIVRTWDPYGLLTNGAPSDEFDHEISSVVAQIPRIRSGKDAALALSRVFSSSFEPGQFTLETCADAGEKLFSALSQRGLIT